MTKATGKHPCHPRNWRKDQIRSALQGHQHWPDCSLTRMIGLCHAVAYTSGWWHDPATGAPADRNDGEMLCLIHSEISEAMEGERKGIMDDHLPSRPMAEVELADAFIRIADYAEAKGYDLAGAIIDKLIYNMDRADHKPKARLQANGKKF